MRVDTRADCCAADGKFQNSIERFLSALDRQRNLSGEATELLTQPQRRGISQMRPADLDDLVPGYGFADQRFF